jgi:hypothetical protein
MSTKVLEELDKEDEEFYKEFHEPVSAGELSPEKIFGFKLPETRVYVPELRCPLPLPSIYSLLPLYDSVIFPIDLRFESGKKIENAEMFRRVHGISPDEMAALARKGHVFPRFLTKFSNYDAKVIKPLLEPGIPRISAAQTKLVSFQGFCKLVQKDCQKCQRTHEQIEKDFPKLPHESCEDCLGLVYTLGYKNKLTIEKIIPDVCMASQTVVSRNLNAVFQTNCPAGKKILGVISSLPEEKTLEYIVCGLGINYVTKIRLEDYVDILDTKTTKAMRKIVSEMLQDPIARKYSQRLNAKIFEFNQQIEELSESKTAKFYKAVSDLVVYGGSKFVEKQTKNYVKLPQEGVKKGAEWLASKVLDLHSWLTGKDWTIAQLYRTRCKLEKCMEPPRAS